MGELPTWAANLLYTAAGGLGALGIGLVKARVDGKKIILDDRALFTSQVLDRIARVEQSLREEREHCDRKLAEERKQSEARLESRDKIITELRLRVTHLESLIERRALNKADSTGSQG
jgi:hypothetical protein